MAEIAVQRKFWPGWIWLFLLFLGGVLLLSFYSREVEPASLRVSGLGGLLVMDPARIFAERYNESLIGRTIEVPNVRVVSVTGDRIFWVGGGEGEQVLVVLNEVPTPGTATEGRYDLTAGQIVTITGTLKRFPGWQEARFRWNADPAYRPEFEKQHVYIEASRLDIAHRP